MLCRWMRVVVGCHRRYRSHTTTTSPTTALTRHNIGQPLLLRLVRISLTSCHRGRRNLFAELRRNIAYDTTPSPFRVLEPKRRVHAGKFDETTLCRRPRSYCEKEQLTLFYWHPWHFLTCICDRRASPWFSTYGRAMLSPVSCLLVKRAANSCCRTPTHFLSSLSLPLTLLIVGGVFIRKGVGRQILSESDTSLACKKRKHAIKEVGRC